MSRLTDEELASLREWLAQWGDGPNWTDKNGEMVPVAKATVVRLVDDCERLREAIRDARNRILDHRPNRIDQLFKANLAALLDHAIDDNRDGFYPDRRVIGIAPLTDEERWYLAQIRNCIQSERTDAAKLYAVLDRLLSHAGGDK